MSSQKDSSWFTPIMIVLVGGLAFYGMTRTPGICPANTARPGSTDSIVTSQSAVTDGPTLVHADDSNFDETVLQANGPVLVDFYADWCGPCQRIAPLLDRVAEDLTEGRIVKVNVDHSPKLATRYNVQSIPTLLVFMDGQIVDRAMGFHNERDLRRLLQQ
jgi:thioredoxin